jgi:hypothetical protein
MSRQALAAIGMLALGAPGCLSADVRGRAPALDDVVDQQAIDVFQARGTSAVSRHPECADGRCIEIRFASNVCPGSVGAASFDILVIRPATAAAPPIETFCGADVFDRVLFSNANADSRPYLAPALVPAHCRDPSGGPRRFDTVALHLSEAGLARVLGGVDLSTGDQVSVVPVVAPPDRPTCPGRAIELVEETGFVVCVPSDPNDPNSEPICTPTTPSYVVTFARTGIAASFTLGNEALGVAPSFVESTVRERGTDAAGLLMRGDCPPGRCAADWAPTRFFPPHGEMRGVFADPPRTFGMLLEIDGITYRSPDDLEAGGAAVRVIDDAGSAFDAASSCSGSPCTVRVVPSMGSAWPMGLRMGNFELVNDDTLLDPTLSDAARLSLPAATQSRDGNEFERGVAVDAIGEIVLSLVTFDTGPVVTSVGGSASLDGRVGLNRDGSPLVDRLELDVLGTPVPAPIVRRDGTFVFVVSGSTGRTFGGFAEVRAFSGTHFVGYDRIRLTIVGPDQDGDGVADPDDNCPLDPNGDQTDLNPATAEGLACEGVIAGATGDSDGDGLLDDEEPGITAFIADVDGDTLEDGEERRLALSPVTSDTDGDGITDEVELSDTAPRDGILDALDPDNDTVGIDPRSSVFLVEEQWRVGLSLLGMADLFEPDTWDAEAEVTFTLMYALAVDRESWLSADAAEPVPDGYDGSSIHPVARVFRLDSIGVSYVSDVSVRTVRCTNRMPESDDDRCDFLPVAEFGSAGV